MKRSLTFGINSGFDYFKLLVLPAVKNANSNPLDVKDALTAAIFVWQLYDWVYLSYNKELLVKYPDLTTRKKFKIFLLKQQCFEHIFQIAIGAKHLECTDDSGRSITSTQLESGFAGIPLLFTQNHLTIAEGSTRYFYILQLNECTEWWQKFIKTIDI